MTTQENETVRDAISRWRQLLRLREQQRDQLRAALSRLCSELHAPAMEYLNPNVQAAWGDACDLLDRMKVELQG